MYKIEFTLLFEDGMGYSDLVWPIMKAEAFRSIKEKDIFNKFIRKKKMSETEKFTGKIQLRPRLENETDKAYFERVTGLEWEVVYNDGTGYSPESLYDALCEHDIKYYDFEEMHEGEKCYMCLDNKLYEILDLLEREVGESYCNLEKIDDTTYRFEAQYYNGGCSLDEIIGDELNALE